MKRVGRLTRGQRIAIAIGVGVACFGIAAAIALPRVGDGRGRGERNGLDPYGQYDDRTFYDLVPESPIDEDEFGLIRRMTYIDFVSPFDTACGSAQAFTLGDGEWPSEHEDDIWFVGFPDGDRDGYAARIAIENTEDFIDYETIIFGIAVPGDGRIPECARDGVSMQFQTVQTVENVELQPVQGDPDLVEVPVPDGTRGVRPLAIGSCWAPDAPIHRMRDTWIEADANGRVTVPSGGLDLESCSPTIDMRLSRIVDVHATVGAERTEPNSVPGATFVEPEVTEAERSAADGIPETTESR